MGLDRRYRIGGLRVEVIGSRLCAALDQLPGFACFTNNRLLRFDITIAESEHPELYHEREVYRFELAEGQHWCCLLVDEDGDVGYRFDSGSLLVHDRFRAGHVYLRWCGDLAELRYMLWLAYAHGALPFGAVPVHASTVVCQGDAVLCLGESGTGKSTHTRLWIKHLQDCYLLNDDSPIVRVERDGVWVYGSPWSGKTPCFRNERVPVAALLRLRQAADNHIEQLNTIVSFASLQPSCPPTLAHDEYCMDGLVDFVGRVIDRVPVYRLDCRPDAAAAHLSHDTIFSK